MNNPKIAKPRRWIWIAIIVIALPIAVMASWLGTEHLFDQTSGSDFCASCHVMNPMVQAYARSRHGGNNRLGIKVKCVDCHLPHDSHTQYFLAKARAGLRDTWTQLTTDVEKIDWQAKRSKRAEFVHDSGCLKCHGELKHSTRPTHPAYFAGGINPFNNQERYRCVSCHHSVGHEDLSRWLLASMSK